MLTRDRLQQILEACAQQHIAVLGDYCLDAYWHADMTRSELSRETPHFPRPIVREVYSPGGAANVAANVAALGVRHVYALTVLGEDWRGTILRDELTRRGVRMDHVVVERERVTPAYIKPILHGYHVEQEGPRLDFQNFTPLPRATEDRVIEAIHTCLSQVNALIVTDQLDPGLVSERVREELIQLAARHPSKVFTVDSRKHISAFRHMVLKPNDMELVRTLRPDQPPEALDTDALGMLGQELARWAERPVFVTIGADGALLCTPERVEHLPAAPVTPPLDIVGAGDTFIAALTAALAAGASPSEAGMVANLAAGVTVEKLNQTGTASPAEILATHAQATHETTT